MNAIGSWMGQLLNGGSGSPVVKKPDNKDQNNQNNNTGGSGDGSGGDNNTNQNNKGGDKGDIIDSIWKDVQGDPADKGKNKNEQSGGDQQQQQIEPEKQVAEFLKSQGLGELKLTDAEITQLKSGEGFQEVVGALNTRIQQGFIRAMSNTSQLMDAKIEKALEKAKLDSQGFYKGEQLRALLREKIPALKDDVLGPVGETITRRLLEKGATIDQAVEGTKKFFERSAKAFGFNNVNSNTRGSFGSSGGRGANGADNQGENEGEMNWLDMLKGEESSSYRR